MNWDWVWLSVSGTGLFAIGFFIGYGKGLGDQTASKDRLCRLESYVREIETRLKKVGMR